MDNTNNPPADPSAGIRQYQRRTIVRTAAWSVPVVAAAVSTPLAAASTEPWNVALRGDCVLDAGGTGHLAPGFLVRADSPSVPIPPVLPVTETASGTWSMTLPAPSLFTGTVDPTLLPGAELAFGTFSLAYASAIVGAVLVPAALAVQGPKVTGDFWVTPSNLGDYLSPPTFTRTYSGTGIDQTVTLTCTWDIQRDLLLTGLVPGDSTFWGYFGALVPPDVTGVPGYDALNLFIQGLGTIPIAGPMIVSAWETAVGSISPALTMTAEGQWTDAQPDHAGQLSNLFAFNC
ncbi:MULTISPECIES: hypothetical protein [Bacteria]|uniref:hypothetical protein n=1 Tax=Bacteria TaxID=2 RepID=UPI003C797E9E